AFEKFLASSPVDKKDTYSRLGECYSESEQFEKAAAAFEEALKPQPQDPALNYKYAKALQNGGQLDKASDVYYLLAQIVPDEANIYYNNVVNMFNEARLYDKAVEAAAKVAELKPQDADAQYNLGYMYIQMKKYEEAIAAFNRTLEIRPDFEFALMQLGYAYNQLKKYRDSIAAYQKLVEINPQSDNAWLNMGIGYMLLKQWDNALEPMIKTIEIKPDNGTAYYNLAICYLNLKDNVSARHVYQELKEVDAELAQRLLKYFR
ncbi:MAG: tetratricopeptide repeat protein, partial [Acidobacteria bacterium]|nr:tetratricopeptide repeat protein [Acidobacteriota bacterium]